MSIKQRRITLKSIANKTGFTVNTVSRALRDKEDISAATKALIRAEAKKMGYIPDTVAGAMRLGETRTIALILGDISNPFFSAQIKEIERRAMSFGYTTMILNTEENSKHERSAILAACGKRADGIIIFPAQKNLDNINLLQRVGIPFVLCGRHFKDFSADSVVWDDVKAGELAATHLIELGHRIILYVGGPSYISSAEERLQGFLNAHRNAGIQPLPGLIRQTEIMTGSCMKEIKQILEEGLRFTGVVAFSDLMAYEAIRTIKEVDGGKFASIPVVGIDNIQSKIMLPIVFSSVGSVEESGMAQAVDLLVKKMNHHSEETEKIVLDVKLFHHNG